MEDRDFLDDAATQGGENAILAGRYHVLRRLGDGGMGSVWLAEDTHLDNRRFAVKMLPSVLMSNKRACRQLKDEALVAMRLSHQNIVTLRAFEENNGNPFLVMDYVEGQTLDAILADKGALSADETVRLLRPVAEALDYAHAEGVVHRDVKPANVIVRPDGHPFVLDFGIAREIQESMTQVTGRNPSGTPLYMSPEQMGGAEPRPAQDIYSFAAMAYECVNGAPPFKRGQIEYQILNTIPETPDSPLASGIMRGLSKKPEDRPRTCVAILDAAADGARRNPPPADAQLHESRLSRPAPIQQAPAQQTPIQQAPAQQIVINNSNTFVVPTNPAGRTPRCDVLEPEKYDKPIFDDGSRGLHRIAILFLLGVIGIALLAWYLFDLVAR